MFRPKSLGDTNIWTELIRLRKSSISNGGYEVADK